jgi:hypothetical protein
MGETIQYSPGVRTAGKANAYPLGCLKIEAKNSPRHCERSEAIHLAAQKKEWIASLRSQ